MRICCLTIAFIISLSIKSQSIIDIEENSGDGKSDLGYFLVDESKMRANYQLVRRMDGHQNIVLAPKKGIIHDELELLENDDWKLNVNTKLDFSGSILYLKTIYRNVLDSYDEVEIIGQYHETNFIVKCLTDEVVSRLLEDPGVVFISAESAFPKTEARVIDLNLNPNKINKVHHFFPELDGSSEVVSIKENYYRLDDIDLVGKNIPSNLNSSIVDNHATEMATIIAGAGNSFITGRGVAPKSFITSSDFASVLPDQDQDYTSLGVTVQNHSYGTQIENFYGVQAAAFDESTFANPYLLHVFSAGNQGLETPLDGIYNGIEGRANLTGNFKMAKNVLVVGAVDTVGREVSFVSRGPAYDGRIKPEIVAYSVTGSSNSAAIVSGTVAVLQQAYQDQYGEQLPAALAKAVLLNEASDVGIDGLDHVTGYGSVDAFQSLQVLKNEQLFYGELIEEEIDQFSLDLPDDAINLKVTICWTDPPSEVGSSNALVNDLDLRLIDNSMVETLPWVLETSPNEEALSTHSFRGEDHLNNMEQVTIAEPNEGFYTIQVEGYEVIGTQKYFIAYSYEKADGFEWNYPTGSDNMPYDGESGSYFSWKSTLEEDNGQLEYSFDRGVSWIILDNDLDLRQGYWRWDPIPDTTAKAIARITTSNQSFISEEFTISRPLRPSVGFNCADSLRIEWSQISGVSDYDVYVFGENGLDFYENVIDTSIMVRDVNTLNSSLFSVQPKLEDGTPVLPSSTFDYTLQGIECFVFSFFQEISLDSGVFLNLALGTTYGIDRITFQRKEGAAYEEITSVVPSSVNVSVLDDAPNQGSNIYRMVIDFENGEQLIRETSNTIFLTEEPLLVYPNPVSSRSFFNVNTKPLTSDQPTFSVYDSKGALMVRKELLSTSDSFFIDDFKSGIYYYLLVDGNERYSGKLVVK